MKPNTRKILKITSYSFLGLFLCLVITSFLLPYFLKDSIKKAVDENSAKMLHAKVHFDKEKLSISLFAHFPNLTVSQGNLCVVGKDIFEGDTLFSAQKLSFTIDIWRVIFDAEIDVKGIYLDSPRIFAKKLKNGKANWDILIPQKDEVKKPTQKLNVNIRKWQITNGLVIYDDQQARNFMQLENLSHQGSGNFKEAVADFYTQTKVAKYILKLADKDYFSNQSLDLQINVKADNQARKYTLKNNSFKINEFAFVVDGFVQASKEDTTLDLTFKAKETQFKNILSLMPFVYGKDFDQLKTKGSLAMEGWAKGKWGKSQIPAFQFDLQVKDGMFQYPTLPDAVSNIQILCKADCKDGILSNTKIDLEKFHLEIGKNFADAEAKIEKIINGNIQAKANVKLNLEDLTKVFPLKDLALKGIFDLNATAKGIYNESQIPVIQASMNLVNGLAKSSQYPKPMENITLLSKMENKTGKYADTKILIEKIQMLLDGEPLEGKASFENLEDLAYNISIKGSVDLGKISKIYPIQGTTLAGRIKGNIQTSGKMSDLNKKNYARLPTKGDLQVNGLSYFETQKLPQGFKISEAKGTFAPENIILEKCEGFLGKSDFQATGKFSQYLAYFFKGETLVGNLNFNANRLDINDLVGNIPQKFSKSATKSIVKIPQNIDFTLKSDIKEVLYPKMNVQALKGNIILKDGKLQMQGVNFSAVSGIFVMNGLYDPTDALRPIYNFDIDIKNMSIAEAHSTFLDKKNSLKPNIQGSFSSFVKISGNLGQDMTPLYDKSMRGIISINMPQTRIKNLIIAQNINKFIKLNGFEQFDIKDLRINAEIKDGFVYYQPFDLLVNELKMTISGQNSLTGDLDFNLRMFIPKKKIGPAAETAIALITKQKLFGVKELILDIAIAGTYQKQIITPLKDNGDAIEIKNKKLKGIIDEKMTEKREQMKENIKLFNKSPEEVLEEARQKADSILETAQKEAIQMKTDADVEETKAIEEASSKGTFARKNAERIASIRKKAEYSKADKKLKKAQKEADKILADAEAIAKKMRE